MQASISFPPEPLEKPGGNFICRNITLLLTFSLLRVRINSINSRKGDGKILEGEKGGAIREDDSKEEIHFKNALRNE